MIRCLPFALAILIAACSGESREEAALENAADQSTPEAAAVLEGAADNGMNAQDALEIAGNAQVGKAVKPAANAQ